MPDGQILSSASDILFPGYLDRFDWSDVWERPLASGTAFEWTMVAALAGSLHGAGWDVSFPVLSQPNGRSVFILRNEIPYQHGAQAGHSASTSHAIPLQDRFLQSMVPKMVFEKEKRVFSLFREGCPYHRIMFGKEYQDRPDIVLVPGRPSDGYPFLDGMGTMLDFAFSFTSGESVSGQLRVGSSNLLPLRKRKPPAGNCIPISGIIECSVNKSVEIASEQIKRYEAIFSRPDVPLPIALITGNALPSLQWPYKQIILEGDAESVASCFQQAATACLESFAILL